MTITLPGDPALLHLGEAQLRLDIACSLFAAGRELVTRFGQKIQATLARIWGEDSDSANGAPPSQPGATPQETNPQTK